MQDQDQRLKAILTKVEQQKQVLNNMAGELIKVGKAAYEAIKTGNKEYNDSNCLSGWARAAIG